jgi:hypothetical protein
MLPSQAVVLFSTPVARAVVRILLLHPSHKLFRRSPSFKFTRALQA